MYAVNRTTRMLLIPLLANACFVGQAWGADRVPIIYSTDLFQPHDDPDDHYDLAAPRSHRTAVEAHRSRNGHVHRDDERAALRGKMAYLKGILDDVRSWTMEVRQTCLPWRPSILRNMREKEDQSE